MKTFREAWAVRGYRLDAAALVSVRLGWEIAIAEAAQTLEALAAEKRTEGQVLYRDNGGAVRRAAGELCMQANALRDAAAMLRAARSEEAPAPTEGARDGEG